MNVIKAVTVYEVEVDGKPQRFDTVDKANDARLKNIIGEALIAISVPDPDFEPALDGDTPHMNRPFAERVRKLRSTDQGLYRLNDEGVTVRLHAREVYAALKAIFEPGSIQAGDTLELKTDFVVEPDAAALVTTLDGHTLKHEDGSPVRAGDLEPGKAYTVDPEYGMTGEHLTNVMHAMNADAAIRELEDMRRRKDEAYSERNQVVALLARIYPSGIAKTDIPGWHVEWHGCVYIDLPTGQASWHYHDSQAYMFGYLPAYTKPYDGHTTSEKYARLGLLAERLDGARQRAAVPSRLDKLQQMTGAGEPLSTASITDHSPEAVSEPIPAGIVWHERHDTFYTDDGRSVGSHTEPGTFRKKWYDRRAEFPQDTD